MHSNIIYIEYSYRPYGIMMDILVYNNYRRNHIKFQSNRILYV